MMSAWLCLIYFPAIDTFHTSTHHRLEFDGRDLSKRILGCGDGPAGFNCELTVRGGRVVSSDPIYRFSADEIVVRIEETYPVVLQQTRQNANGFVWTTIQSVEQLGQVRMTAMGKFLSEMLVVRQHRPLSSGPHDIDNIDQPNE